MAARAIASGTISFGLVSIPVKLYTATSSQKVRFHLLHNKCNGRMKQQYYCPVDDEIVDRSDFVKGYEYAKGQFVTFTSDELKTLEADRTGSLDIVEFVPLASVDFVQVERSYYLGPDKGGDKAYQLLAQAMTKQEQVAVARWAARGKEQLVMVRPYRDGLVLHQLFYANEVRSYEDLDRGAEFNFADVELDLANKLIEQLASDEFDPAKYSDSYTDRVRELVDQKVAGEEIAIAPEQPKAQIIDLFEALKQSLSEDAPAPAEKEEAKPKAKSKNKGKAKTKTKKDDDDKPLPVTKAVPRKKSRAKKTGS